MCQAGEKKRKRKESYIYEKSNRERGVLILLRCEQKDRSWSLHDGDV